MKIIFINIQKVLITLCSFSDKLNLILITVNINNMNTLKKLIEVKLIKINITLKEIY